MSKLLCVAVVLACNYHITVAEPWYEAPIDKNLLQKKTVWSVTAPSADSYSLNVNDQPFTVKGVCYSPVTINDRKIPYSGETWDTYKDSKGVVQANWFPLWGSGSLGVQVNGKEAVARGDLDTIRAMGANTLRLYEMSTRDLEPKVDSRDPDVVQKRSHQQFLDTAWNKGKNPLYVMAGIALPDFVFRLSNYNSLPVEKREREEKWVQFVFEETLKELGKHPAVMGFIFMNELTQEGLTWTDSGCGGPTDATNFFYAQAKKFADRAKELAPGKLCGWASHDAPPLMHYITNQPSKAAPYASMLTSVDFWGVNAYTMDLSPALGDWNFGANACFASFGSKSIPKQYRKPVILTEIGWPATGHNAAGVESPNGPITESAVTYKQTAEMISNVLPQCYKKFSKTCMGAIYFEFSDEWWKQGAGAESAQDGTVAAASGGFPNKYWDEEGFGIYGLKIGEGRKVTDAPRETCPAAKKPAQCPRLPVDQLITRAPVVDALKKVWA